MLFSAGSGFLVCLLVEFRVMRGGVNAVDPMEPDGYSTIPGETGDAEAIAAGASTSAGPSVLDSNQNKEN